MWAILMIFAVLSAVPLAYAIIHYVRKRRNS
jgi:hypothetical protein